MSDVCKNCGEVIILADDGKTWLHIVGYGWSRTCATTYAEPARLVVPNR